VNQDTNTNAPDHSRSRPGFRCDLSRRPVVSACSLCLIRAARGVPPGARTIFAIYRRLRYPGGSDPRKDFAKCSAATIP
jgi:hypothetical protein